MKNKIIIETHAYNASSTLERTIKSVLAQTHTNWEWHLYENASTDGGATLDIITRYAKMDSRIKPYQNIFNIPKNSYLFLATHTVLAEHKDDYFSYICADDTWEPDFFESMLKFQQENNLDIASCISKHINAETGEILNKFFLQENIFATTPDEFGEKINIFYSFYRELWGHLIPFSTLQKISCYNYSAALNEYRYSFLKLNFQILASCERIGILAKPLHNYYLSEKGIVRERLLRNSRLEHFRNITNILRTFLISKVGFISKDNEKFILERYLKTVYDYLPTVFSCDDDIKNLLFIMNIVRFEETITAFESPLVSIELKANFANKLSLWLKDAIQNKKLEKEFVVGDKEGHFEYSVSSSNKSNLGYMLYDFYNQRKNYSSWNKKSQFYNNSNTLINIIIELQQFLVKYATV